MVPPGAFPFDGLIIHAQTPEVEKYLADLNKSFGNNTITTAELEQRINVLLQDDKIQIEKRIADPYAKGVFNSKKKKAWDQKNRNNNPLSGKGKSYGKHVEHGWGKYVEPTGHDPDLDGLWR